MSAISGKYRLDTRLGGGGMAEVFLGSMLGIEGFTRKVAIKRILPGFSDNPSFAQMFIAEAQISSQLVHPNIVSVLDFDRDPEGRLFLVMELVEGRDMDALIQTGPLPFPLVIFLISEVLRGLGFAHDLPAGNEVRGIVHRDVSPHNVLLSWEGAVKVSDFGIAKARAASAATASVFIKGKPAYMSPEQANGERLDGRSDLFAVGVMLWEMIVGRRLFVGEDTRATLAAVLFGQIPRPRALRPDVPKDLEHVVMKLLERDLPARYATAELAIQDLLECEDAPKAGRELLVRTLAERFPNEAHVRQSRIRPRGADASQPVAMPGTMADGSVGRPSAASLGEMRARETGSLQQAGMSQGAAVPMAMVQTPSGAAQVMPAATVPGWKRQGGKAGWIAAAVAVVVVATAAVIGVVSASGGAGKAAAEEGTGTAAGTAAGTGTGAGSATAAAGSASAAAAGSASAAVAATAAGSGSGTGTGTGTGTGKGEAGSMAVHAKKDASSGEAAHAAVERRVGKLEVLAFPVLTVIVDRKSYGDTPITIPLPAGKHLVRLVNADTGHDETVPVTIRDHQTFTLDRRK